MPVEKLALESGKQPDDLVYAVPVDALVGRLPAAGHVAITRLQKALVRDGMLFADGRSPLKEIGPGVVGRVIHPDAASRRGVIQSSGILVPTCRIDHIAVVSPSLAAGGEFVENLLGVSLQPGGEHPRMGTHNLLLRLGDATYLEVIAINPAAPPPSRPRWFELDRLVADSEPRLGCWVARTDDIRASLSQASEHLGESEPMSRGALEWRISIPRDGSLPLGGAAPALIQWNASAHPASSMQDKGCSLVKLELLHPEPARLSALLGSLNFAEPDGVLAVVAAAAPALVAHIDTPHGLRTLWTPDPSMIPGRHE